MLLEHHFGAAVFNPVANIFESTLQTRRSPTTQYSTTIQTRLQRVTQSLPTRLQTHRQNITLYNATLQTYLQRGLSTYVTKLLQTHISSTLRCGVTLQTYVEQLSRRNVYSQSYYDMSHYDGNAEVGRP